MTAMIAAYFVGPEPTARSARPPLSRVLRCAGNAWPGLRLPAPGNRAEPEVRGRLCRYPVVPPLGPRIRPWVYDREMCKRRNEVERLFRRLKGFRRIFSRFEKLDVMFLGLVVLVLIFDVLR